MMLRDIPLIGAFVASLGALTDMLLHSGEFVLWALTNLGIVLPFVTSLDRLAARIPGLPQDITGPLVTLILALSVGVTAGRIIKKYDQ